MSNDVTTKFLEDRYEYYLDRGYSEKEAAQKASEDAEKEGR